MWIDASSISGGACDGCDGYGDYIGSADERGDIENAAKDKTTTVYERGVVLRRVVIERG